MNNNYIYNDEKGQFIMSQLKITKELVEKFINKINNEIKFTDIDNKDYDSYRHYKIIKLK